MSTVSEEVQFGPKIIASLALIGVGANTKTASAFVGVDGPQRHRLCQNEVVADLRQRRSYGASGGGLASSSLDETDGGSPCPKLMT